MDEGRFGGRQPQAVRNALSVLSAVARLAYRLPSSSSN